MILEELERFTSLESAGGVPIESHTATMRRDNEGSRPLDASEFVNPSHWFEGDQDVETAIDKVRKSAPAGATMGWFEPKEDPSRVAPPASVAMGPSLNPSPRSASPAGSQPVMTFRPPGATPTAPQSRQSPRSSTTGAAPGRAVKSKLFVPKARRHWCGRRLATHPLSGRRDPVPTRRVSCRSRS